VQVTPGPVSGRLPAPPSKSYTHRALVAGFLAGRKYRVRTPLDAEDTRATRRGLRALGAAVERGRDEWVLQAGVGRARPGRSRQPVVDCGESGTTLRFLVAVAARRDEPVRFVGAPGLARRPMDGLFSALRGAGARVAVETAGASLPCSVVGPLRAGALSVDGGVSSQFLSALLLVLPTLPGDSRLSVRGRAVSRPYVEATEAVLRAHAIEIERQRRTYRISGDQRYRGSAFRVPGDASSAAYLWAAAALAGSSVTVENVPARWPQADRAILEILARMGASVRVASSGASVTGHGLQPIDVDLDAAPDLYPLVGVLAAFARGGESRLRGAAHVAFKESDRRRATVRLVRAFGGRARSDGRGLVIRGAERPPKGVRLRNITDHRVVMSAAVGALAARTPSRLGEAGSVAKSFPGFWSALRELGAEVRTTP
jgi:3-phosphoshikimate 1-carboxyvinyltransferase